ncbi:MAG: FeS-binding protein [Desulfobacterales bacterium]|nr:FeS-binding protein [Desulfobacterales bacterium]
MDEGLHGTGLAARPAKPILRGVLDACADCDTCRLLMDESCLLFPALYRLYDKEKEEGVPTGAEDLRRLSELCTLCGLCPCPDIRADVIRGKTEAVRREGMPLANRLLADVQRFGRWAGRLSPVFNRMLAFAPIERVVQKIAGIHPRRRLPRIAAESFFAWAHRQGLHRAAEGSAKVAYFAGCTAGYFFPEVARASVAVLAHNGVGVHVPPQQCCGLPTLLEGDARTTLERARFNQAALLKCVAAGYDLVCSCPSCGFLMKVLLKEKACYAQEYQRSVNAGADEIKVPDSGKGKAGFICLKKSMYHQLLTDDGYFSKLDPLARMALSEKIMDVGEYLVRLQGQGRLNTRFRRMDAHMVYFAPCHQRDQRIGSPYEALLALIPGLTVVPVGGAMDCCGMGGSMGFKQGFYEDSISLGSPLIAKIEAAAPQAIITDCLSCRLQFTHLLPYPVFHPVEILSRAYGPVPFDEEKSR